MSASPRLQLLALAAALAGSGCERVLGAPEYFLEEEAGMDALVATFEPPSPACAACLRTGQCARSFDDCSSTPGCPDFVACVRAEASPAAEAWCVVRLAPSEATRDLARELFYCWESCVNDCAGGTDFGCVANYTWPPPPEPVIELTQTLTFVNAQASNGAVRGARVSICEFETDCKTPVQLGAGPLVTDSAGRYVARVPINVSPVTVAGFSGYRLIEGDGFLPHRLQRSTPLMVGHAEHTQLLSSDLSSALPLALPFLGLSDATGVLLIQVFDCADVGAGGVFLEFPNSPGARAYYRDGVSLISLGEGGTLASEAGSAVAAGLEVGRVHRVVARHRDGLVVAEADVYVPGGAVIMLSLLPNSDRR